MSRNPWEEKEPTVSDVLEKLSTARTVAITLIVILGLASIGLGIWLGATREQLRRQGQELVAVRESVSAANRQLTTIIVRLDTVQVAANAWKKPLASLRGAVASEESWGDSLERLQEAFSDELVAVELRVDSADSASRAALYEVREVENDVQRLGLTLGSIREQVSADSSRVASLNAGLEFTKQSLQKELSGFRRQQTVWNLGGLVSHIVANARRLK